MPLIAISDLDDPRLAPYRSLPTARRTRPAETFVAEGRLLVVRLLASSLEVQSLLVRETALAELRPHLPIELPVYVAPRGLVNQIVGFTFHQGVMACGRRRPLATVRDLLPADQRPLTVVICPRIQDPDNLGQILRNGAALGADLVVLGRGCADPFSRRALRVSMGAAFTLPLAGTHDLPADLAVLRHEAGVQLAAAVLDPRAEPLPTAARPARFGLLLGNEYEGLDPDILQLCDRQITLPMRPGTDSLNVATASGIFLYHFGRPGG